ncbi:hypothetical protein [Pseudomonas sp. EA_105y_Pfl2_R69]|uniref:hypothetical protein n=1 Tax=Pseudomonas sp. EA_105y_Pfl2_R69 TaxID=3088683 RepID=UPI0030D81339
MSLSQAMSIASAYERRRQLFDLQHEVLSKLFAGTDLVADMRVLKEKVADARQFNVDAGWLSVEDEDDYFVSMIKRDYQGHQIKSLADVPQALTREYADLDEGGFQAYIKEQREQCRLAYEEMPVLCASLEHVLTGEVFFDNLRDLTDKKKASAMEARSIETLLDNLESLWAAYKLLAISLMQMANEPADGDFDPTFMTAMLFNE